MTRFRVAHWPNGADVPLNLMIDDLADVFVEHRGMSRREKDWGHLLDGPGSAWEFVERRIRSRWPELKISLFIPVNRRPVVEPAPPGSYYGPIDARPEMVDFLRRLDTDPGIECAYHGKDHFRELGGRSVQEWLSFETVEAAVDETQRGLEIFERVFGRKPLGGKFPGYASRDTSMDSILLSGFKWWCTRFNRGSIQTLDCNRKQLDCIMIADSDCVDMPSNMAGNVLPPYLAHEWMKWPRRWMQRTKMEQVVIKQIAQISQFGVPMTLQEHIAPSRSDGKRQGVNLQDDLRSLQFILAEACRNRIWNAHPSEIADHVLLRERVELFEDAQTLRVVVPATGLLKTLELELVPGSERVCALIDKEENHHPVRDTAVGRFCALPVSDGTYRIIEA